MLRVMPSLPLPPQTKTADNKMTALAYIVMVLAQHRPGLLHLVDDFPNVRVSGWLL